MSSVIPYVLEALPRNFENDGLMSIDEEVGMEQKSVDFFLKV